MVQIRVGNIILDLYEFDPPKLNFAIDVGVNKGQTIFFLKKINKNTRIIGFEPHKDLYSKLINNNQDSNIRIFNLGCSDQEGEAVFKENILNCFYFRFFSCWFRNRV